MEKNDYQENDVIKKIIAVADSKAAFDFYAVDVVEFSDITDIFILMSCKNERQIKAVTNEISKVLKKEYELAPIRLDANFESRWVVMDYVNIIVHIFHEDIRALYDLEKLWEKGKIIKDIKVSK